MTRKLIALCAFLIIWGSTSAQDKISQSKFKELFVLIKKHGLASTVTAHLTDTTIVLGKLDSVRISAVEDTVKKDSTLIFRQDFIMASISTKKNRDLLVEVEGGLFGNIPSYKDEQRAKKMVTRVCAIMK